MYQEFYNLKDYPFRLAADPAFMCMTVQHQEALSGLLEKRRFVTALCNNPTLTRQEFFDLLLMKFGVQCDSTLKSRQLAALQDVLMRNRMDGRPSLLIVDEAQRLSPELLEEIRLLLNLETPREKLMEIIIAGQPELSEVLARPELRQLKQRVNCICRLRPLNLDELPEYIQHRLAQAGLPQQKLFPEETFPVIFGYTKGIPRLVNSLCNSALQTGFAMQIRQVTTAVIDEAARDLDLQSNMADSLPLMNLTAAAVGDELFPPAPVVAPPRLTAVPKVSRVANGASEPRLPMETYSSRQKSLGFLANLMDRWR